MKLPTRKQVNTKQEKKEVQIMFYKDNIMRKGKKKEAYSMRTPMQPRSAPQTLQSDHNRNGKNGTKVLARNMDINFFSIIGFN